MIPDSVRKYVYYEEPGIVLLHGDCLEILPLLEPDSVDLVLTDPPYGIEGGKGGDSKRGKGDYSMFVDDEVYIKKHCIPAINKCLELTSRVALTPGNRHIQNYPKARDIGCFFQPASISHGPWGFVTFNPILFYGKDFRAGKGALPTGISVTEKPSASDHPCAKPIKAWKWLLIKVSQKSEIVLDPFLGSGTTAVAAKQLGRKCIGIEIESRYLDIAIERLRQEVLF